MFKSYLQKLAKRIVKGDYREESFYPLLGELLEHTYQQTNEEIQHYCRVATALYHTLELQKQIDEVYAGVEQEIVEWSLS